MRVRRSGEPRAAARARGNAARAPAAGGVPDRRRAEGTTSDREGPDHDRGGRGRGRLPESAGPSGPAPLPKRKPRQPGSRTGRPGLPPRARRDPLPQLRRPRRDRLATRLLGGPGRRLHGARARMPSVPGSAGTLVFPARSRVARPASAVPLERASHALGGRDSRGGPSSAPVRAARRSLSDHRVDAGRAPPGRDASPQDVRELGRPPVPGCPRARSRSRRASASR